MPNFRDPVAERYHGDRWAQNRGEPSPLRRMHGGGGDAARGNKIPYSPSYDRGITAGSFGALAPGAESDPLTVVWPTGGFVVGMRGTTVADGTGTGLSSIGVQITLADGKESILIGAKPNGVTVAQYITLGSLLALPEAIFFLTRPVYPTLAWVVQCKNFHADNTYTPEIVFLFDSDPPGVRRNYFKSVRVPQGTSIEVAGPAGSFEFNVDEIGGPAGSRQAF